MASLNNKYQTSGDIFLQGRHVLAEGLQAGLGDTAGGTGHLALEALLDRDVTGRRKLVYLDAEPIPRQREGTPPPASTPNEG